VKTQYSVYAFLENKSQKNVEKGTKAQPDHFLFTFSFNFLFSSIKTSILSLS